MQNFDQTLNAFKNRQPFQPFTVVMADGDCFKADFPNALVGRDGMAFICRRRPNSLRVCGRQPNHRGPGGGKRKLDHFENEKSLWRSTFTNRAAAAAAKNSNGAVNRSSPPSTGPGNRKQAASMKRPCV